MNNDKVIIVGSSKHSKVVIDIFEKEGKYEIIGLLDTNKEIGQKTLEYSVIGNDNDLPHLISEYPNCKVFIAIGDNYLRKKVRDQLIKRVPKIEFASTIHPSAQIGKNVQIGSGVAIMAGAIVNSETTIRDFVIINTKASIDHDGIMNEFSSLGPNVTCGGNVTVGEFTAISIGSTIIHGISIGDHSVVGAGALVLKNHGENLIIYGAPAKEIRKRVIGEQYL